jgi:hypothetical protein
MAVMEPTDEGTPARDRSNPSRKPQDIHEQPAPSLRARPAQDAEAAAATPGHDVATGTGPGMRGRTVPPAAVTAADLLHWFG